MARYGCARLGKARPGKAGKARLGFVWRCSALRDDLLGKARLGTAGVVLATPATLKEKPMSGYVVHVAFSDLRKEDVIGPFQNAEDAKQWIIASAVKAEFKGALYRISRQLDADLRRPQ